MWNDSSIRTDNQIKEEVISSEREFQAEATDIKNNNKTIVTESEWMGGWIDGWTDGEMDRQMKLGIDVTRKEARTRSDWTLK